MICYPLLKGSHLPCRLHKFFYGLQQSPRDWFDRFIIVVQQLGMIHIEVGHSILYHYLIQRCIYLIIYAYDIVIIGGDKQGTTSF